MRKVLPAGMILCGGASQRMGQSKALLPWQGRTLLAHVVELLQPLTSSLVVVAAPNQELPTLPSAIQIARDPTTHAGPLAGVMAGLLALGSTSTWAVVRACDMPHLQPAWYATLLNAATSECRIILPEVAGKLEPLAGCYHTSCLDDLRRAWEQGERSLQRACAESQLCRLGEDKLRQIDPQLQSLVNINTPAEYQQRSQ